MKDHFYADDPQCDVNDGLTEERLLALRKQINYIARSLQVVKAEVD